MKYFHRKLNYSQMKRKYFPINVEIFPRFKVSWRTVCNYWLDVELRMMMMMWRKTGVDDDQEEIRGSPPDGPGCACNRTFQWMKIFHHSAALDQWEGSIVWAGPMRDCSITWWEGWCCASGSGPWWRSSWTRSECWEPQAVAGHCCSIYTESSVT